ncbi:bifunctional diguanylate cyclase/phosphodiesterase [Undibacterium sp. SXout7W]|uniref:bifunctional diguanylate cyclase/phosphodiesterase n=1 Tax=Undibacterium sp. SXout7W TaxID=3413049 RepID=UPI003BF2A0A9
MSIASTSAHTLRLRVLIFGVLGVLLLIATMALPPLTYLTGGKTSMLAIHLLMEMFAIIIAMLVVTLSWHTFDMAEARYSKILICGFLIVGTCDLLHALTYAGMPAFLEHSSTPRAIFFWLMGRTFEVLTMAVVAMGWKIPLPRLFWLCTGMLTSGVLIFMGSYHIDVLPVTFIEGQGVTQFKANFEYLLCAMNILVAFLLWQRGEKNRQSRYYLLALSSFLMGVGEIAFTAYVTPSDFQNIFGHTYKLVAYTLLYMATFATSIRAPFEALQKSEDKLRENETQLRIAAIAFESQQGMMITDKNGIILRVNQAFTNNTGYAPEDAIGRTAKILQSGRHTDTFYAEMEACIESTGRWQGEVWDKRKNGEIYPNWLTISAVSGDDGVVTHYVNIDIDISARKAAEDQLHQLAFFDPLTQLPNRRLLLERLGHALSSSGRHPHGGAVMFLDLDNFKTLNDTMGHDVGDCLLIKVAERLKTSVRQSDTVARLGGDEFVVMLENFEAGSDTVNQVKIAAEKLRAALDHPFQFVMNAGSDQQKTIDFHSTVSIGVSLFGGHQESVDEILKQADLAMYQAKDAGRNTIRFFDPKMQLAVTARVAMESAIRDAIHKTQFELHYQPQLSEDGQHLTGAEALLRWPYPSRGMIPPSEFIPLSEETGLILPLGHWVLKTACQQLATWAQHPATAHLTMAVNVSALQFHQTNFVENLLSLIADSGANPHKLKLELTESMLVNNVKDIIEKMHALKNKGVGFSLDDFGTGYSSLSYLKRLPLDQLKIDQAFVRDMLIDQNDAAIAKMIIALADTLGLVVIAEGVETENQRQFLSHNGCHDYQGYLFGKPMGIKAFEDYVKNYQPVLAVAETS